MLSRLMSWADFALRLPRGRFLLAQVGFFQLICLGHILAYAFTMADFSRHRSSFPNSYALGTFCHMSSSRWISLGASQVFSTNMPRANFILRLRHNGFSWYGLGYPDSHASCIFCLTLSPWWISLSKGWIFLTHMSRAHFVLCLRRDRFLLV